MSYTVSKFPGKLNTQLERILTGLINSGGLFVRRASVAVTRYCCADPVGIVQASVASHFKPLLVFSYCFASSEGAGQQMKATSYRSVSLEPHETR